MQVHRPDDSSVCHLSSRAALTYGCSVPGKGRLCHTTGPGEPGDAAEAGVMDSLGSPGPGSAGNWPVLKKPHGGFRWPKYAGGYLVRSCKPAEELERNALTGTRPPALLGEPCASPDGPSSCGARRAARVCGRTEPSRRSVASRAGRGQVTWAPSSSSSLSSGLRAPFCTPSPPGRRPPPVRLPRTPCPLRCPSRPAPTPGRRDRRGFGQLSCCLLGGARPRRAGCGLSHHGPRPQRPAPGCLGAPSPVKAQPSRLASPARPQPSPRVLHRGAQRVFAGAK